MRMQQWKPSKLTLAGRPAIQLGSELCLAGLRGEIWQSSSNTYKAVVSRDDEGNLLPHERIYTLTLAQVPKMLETLGYRFSQTQQCDFANNFSSNKVNKA